MVRKYVVLAWTAFIIYAMVVVFAHAEHQPSPSALMRHLYLLPFLFTAIASIVLQHRKGEEGAVARRRWWGRMILASAVAGVGFTIDYRSPMDLFIIPAAILGFPVILTAHFEDRLRSDTGSGGHFWRIYGALVVSLAGIGVANVTLDSMRPFEVGGVIFALLSGGAGCLAGLWLARTAKLPSIT